MTILMCNMAWMRDYNGITLNDYPINGGAHIEEEGYGHEVINFQRNGRFVYGYVQAKNATINIDRIGGQGEDFIDDVLVVWRARSKIGSVVVGWYRNARVYRHEQEGNQNRVFRYDGEDYYPKYLIRARAIDSFLIPTQHRSFKVPVTHKGFGSQTFVSFLDKNLDEVNNFKESLLEYIDRAEDGNFTSPNRGARGSIDIETKNRIEQAAVESAIEYYLNQGYDVHSVESENIGYDLVASKGSSELYIEVKGTSIASLNNITVVLTPNEYATSIRKRGKYRIVIVYDAIDTPQLLEFFWITQDEAWFSEQSLTYLQITEKTSAHLTIENG